MSIFKKLFGSINKIDKNGLTALMSASENANTEALKRLLERGAKLNLQNKEGFTALMFASRKGNTEAVNLLLDNGAKLDMQNNYGGTALTSASYVGHIEVVKLLLEKGAKLDLQADDGGTALILASQNGHTEVVRLLLDRGAKSDLQVDGFTAVMLASQNGHAESVKLLLAKGAKLDLQKENKAYYEKDNIGLRHETKDQGESYFISLFSRDPESILFYFFPDKAQAENALSDVSCIKIAKDSGKFICTEIINFGVFEAYDEDGKPIWAALLAGKNLTVETWEEGKKAFIKNGGIVRREDKIDNMPHRTVQPKTQKAEAKFIKKENKMMAGFPATQEVYEAPSKAVAIEFLKEKTVSQNSYFIVVETPEGKVVKDIQGIFDN